MAMKIIILISLLSAVADIESKSVRTKRSPSPDNVAAAEVNSGIYNQGADYLGGLLADQTVWETVGELGGTICGIKGGCYYGYCWAGCNSTPFNNEWCYTTRGYSQDYGYVRCDRDSDCDKCWKCAGTCTV